MRVMILGGTGFIGSVLTKELLSRGHDVVIT
ncbi:MAG: NAD(P)-dependent oxidoreductase, partial [Mailhella sp.]|nr:NAD(P)-dependent oxidoreductase [Mailhella sp.]